MKKLCLAILFALAFLALVQTPAAAAEEINNFSTELVISKNGSVEVTETIDYYFPTQRHGIYRYIPTVYKNQENKRFEMPITVRSVTDQAGQPYKFTTSRQGDELTIKIGDPDTYVIGTKTYVIKYQAQNVAESFSEHDEVYWNVTGNGWTVPIQSAQAYIRLESDVPKAPYATSCFTGKSGSLTNTCSVSAINELPIVTTTQSLNSGEGLTIVSSFEKGVLNPISKKAPLSTTIFSDTLMLILSLIWYLGLPATILVVYLLTGRDPKINTAIPALFDPPSEGGKALTPAEAGALLDEHVSEREITATILSLAIKGYMKITDLGPEEKGLLSKLGGQQSNISFERTDKPIGDDLEPYEIHLLSDLFKGSKTRTTKELAYSLHQTTESVKKAVYRKLVDRGYFTMDPSVIRTIWYVIGLICLFTINFPLGLTCLVMARAMPRKTLKGAQVKLQIDGLRKFIKSQNRQLTFQEKNWYFFEKLLPYAAAFGATEVWAGRFEGMMEVPKDVSWYSSAGNLNLARMAGSMSGLQAGVTSMAASPSRSSSGFSGGGGGGGFSGGGFGGGGGGSW